MFGFVKRNPLAFCMLIGAIIAACLPKISTQGYFIVPIIIILILCFFSGGRLQQREKEYKALKKQIEKLNKLIKDCNYLLSYSSQPYSFLSVIGKIDYSNKKELKDWKIHYDKITKILNSWLSKFEIGFKEQGDKVKKYKGLKAHITEFHLINQYYYDEIIDTFYNIVSKGGVTKEVEDLYNNNFVRMYNKFVDTLKNYTLQLRELGVETVRPEQLNYAKEIRLARVS